MNIGRSIAWRISQIRARLPLMLLRDPLQVDPRKTLLIFSAPRGGSTLLEQIVRTIPGTATMWEPLDIDRNPRAKKVPFYWRQHIPEGERWPEAEKFFTDLFSGRMLSAHLTQSTTINELKKADRLVVKFARGNLLLPWLVGRFELPKPVLLLRHPCAVVSSQLKKGAWNGLPNVIKISEHRHSKFLELQQGILDTATTLAERQAAQWCLDYKYLIEHPLNDVAWTTITYEELITRPKPTIEKVFAPWNISVPDEALAMVRKPSSTTQPGSPVHDAQAQLTFWTRTLAPAQIDGILAMVGRFGITLYDRDLMPKKTFTP